MNRDTRIVIIGLGSIGQRHLRNLHQLGYRQLFAVSSGRGTLSREDLPLMGVAPDLSAAVKRYDPEVAFICNPTSMHMDSALEAARSGMHLFLEKPIGTSKEGVAELSRLVAGKGLVAMTGFQFRQHPVLQHIRRLLQEGELGEVIAVRMHWGEYLPGWHPWEDHRKSYSADPGLGGGVTFTLCHPFDYLRWMLGEPVDVQASIRNSGEIGIPADDVHLSTWTFENGAVASIYLDYLERPPSHELTLVASRGKIVWSNENGHAFLFREGNGPERLDLPEGHERNDLFLEEAREFMHCVSSGSTPSCTLEDGVANLKMILASKLSSNEQRRVAVSDLNWT